MSGPVLGGFVHCHFIEIPSGASVEGAGNVSFYTDGRTEAYNARLGRQIAGLGFNHRNLKNRTNE